MSTPKGRSGNAGVAGRQAGTAVARGGGGTVERGGADPGADFTPPDRRSPVLGGIACAAAVALLAVSVAGYDERLFAPHIVARAALMPALVLALAVVCILALRPGREVFRADVVDAVATAFAAWVMVSVIASPAPWVAWLGYYNRGTGALFILSAILLFLAARRILVSRRAVVTLVWAVAALLVLMAATAVAQSAGSALYWQVIDPWPGRWTGTTGNPLTMAGLSLLGLWLGGWSLATWLAGTAEGESQGGLQNRQSRTNGRGKPGRGKPAATRQARRNSRRVTTASARTRWSPAQSVAAVGLGAALLVNLLAVTRSSYLGWAAALVLAGIWLARLRRRRELVAVAAIFLVVVGSAFIPVPDGQGGSRTLLGRVEKVRTASGDLSRNDTTRLDTWAAAARGIADRPLFGYGAGAYVIVDRAHASLERRFATPGRFISDAHDLPLLVGATTGVPGLLLFGGLVVLVALALFGGVPPPPGTQSPAGPPRAAPPPAALAALVYLAATGVYFLFGPLDIAVAVPMVLLAGVGLPLGAGLVRPVWSLGPLHSALAGRLVTAVLAAALALACAAAALSGVQLYRADLAMAAFARSDVTADAERATHLFPWEPFYALEAGAAAWRTQVDPEAPGAAADPAALREGEALVRQGLRRDPTGPTGYADLARMDITSGQLANVPGDVREGLRWNPAHPSLEGLWAYAAVEALQQPDGAATAGELHASLMEYGPRSPDAWYWASVYLDATGDKPGAQAAMDRARRLAPRLEQADYADRLKRGR